MKTSIKTLVATGLIAVAISSSSVVLANTGKESKTVETVSANMVKIASIKRIVVSGDVEVTISQSPKSGVLYTNDGGRMVTVKKIGNAVYIDAKKGVQGARVTVYVDDIYRIEASQNAVVRSDSKLNLKYLQVYLKDNAILDLNANTENLLTVMENSSKLNLSGATDFHTITMDKSARVSIDKFTAKNTDMTRSDVYVSSRS